MAERDKTECYKYYLQFIPKSIPVWVRLLGLLTYSCCPSMATGDNFASDPWLLREPPYTSSSGPFILKGWKQPGIES